jgi:hypothetical protein
MNSSEILRHVNLGDPSPFGQDHCSGRVPPHDIVCAYGTEPFHTAARDGDWQTGRAVRELSAHLLRSEQSIDKTRDWEKWTNTVFRFGHDEFVHICRRSLVVYAPSPAAAEARLQFFAAQYLAPPGEIVPTFHIINSSYGMLRAERVEIHTGELPHEGNLDLYYGVSFPAWHGSFIDTIVGKKSGLTLIEGPPGTGKTTYLRLLMAKLKETHRFYYLPPSSLSCLVQSELVDFWVEEIERHGRTKRFVVVLEDCEAALMTRENDNRSQVSAILNITDGMFADFLRTHVICTINCPSSRLDPALLRPGRLVAHRNFPRLAAAQAGNLAVYLGKDLPDAPDYSLAEVFAGSGVREEAPRPVGFAA